MEGPFGSLTNIFFILLTLGRDIICICLFTCCLIRLSKVFCFKLMLKEMILHYFFIQSGTLSCNFVLGKPWSLLGLSYTHLNASLGLKEFLRLMKQALVLGASLNPI